jgi:hypothetical protein
MLTNIACLSKAWQSFIRAPPPAESWANIEMCRHLQSDSLYCSPPNQMATMRHNVSRHLASTRSFAMLPLAHDLHLLTHLTRQAHRQTWRTPIWLLDPCTCYCRQMTWQIHSLVSPSNIPHFYSVLLATRCTMANQLFLPSITSQHWNTGDDSRPSETHSVSTGILPRHWTQHPWIDSL